MSGGYLWSPKRKSNDQRNPFYESMREVAPGDVIFSFFDTRIAALGIARSYCYESPKPTEFGSASAYWEAIGWKIDVSFRELRSRVRPKDHIAELRSLLPKQYSPLRPNGGGLQSVYLAEVDLPFATPLERLIGDEARKVADVASAVGAADRVSPAREPTLEEWERRVEVDIQDNRAIPEPERQALILARRGQGQFRVNVLTDVTRDGRNKEWLHGENGICPRCSTIGSDGYGSRAPIWPAVAYP